MTNPLFLLALPLLLLPFLFRRIRPLQPHRIAFSQMPVLQKVLKKIPPLRRRLEIPLLIARILSMLFLILIPLGLLMLFGSAGGQRAAMILLIDDTPAAMRSDLSGTSLFEHEKDKALEELSRLGIGSEAAVVGFSGRFRGWFSVSQARTEISGMEAGFSPSNWMEVRRKFRSLLRSRSEGELLVSVIGDGKAEDAASLEASLKTLPKGSRINMTPLEFTPAPNRTLSARINNNGSALTLEASVLHPREDATLRFRLEGTDGEVKDFQIIPAKEGHTVFRREFESSPIRSGALILEGQDGFLPDNRLYFADERGARLNITVLERRESERRLKEAGYFLRRGLGILEQTRPLEVTGRDPRRWKLFNTGFTDLVILNDPPFLSKEEALRLREFVQKGGQVLFLPGPETPPELIDEHFSSIAPALLKELEGGEFTLNPEPDWVQILGRFRDSPFRGRWQFYRLHPKAEVLARFKDGVPFWVAAPMGKGRFHMASTPLHLAWHDAVVLGDFPRLLEAMLKLASSKWGGGEGVQLQVGKIPPEEVTSWKTVLGTGQTGDNRLAPGLYECDLNDGSKVLLACNLPNQSSPREAWRKLPGEAGASFGEELLRADRLFVPLFLLALLAEAIFLLGRFKKLDPVAQGRPV